MFVWLAKSRASITVWKTWKGSRHYTPFWTARRINTLMKKAISTFWSPTDYYIKEIKNFFRVPIRYRNTSESQWENEKLKWEHEPPRRVFRRYFKFTKTFTSISITCGNTENVFYFLNINYKISILKSRLARIITYFRRRSYQSKLVHFL